IKENGDKIPASDKTAAEAAVAELKSVLDSEDLDGIKAKTDALAQVSMKLGEAMYKAGQGEAPAAGGEAPGAQPNEPGVVDADFEEVQDDKK
ncbi:Hsp70 family protein, partial [Acinetobacter baumannii]